MKAFEIKFNLADSEYMTALRLAVGAVCAVSDLDVDAAEDMKVCVTEGCLILKGCGFDSARVTLNVDGGFSAEIEGEGGKIAPCDNEFSLALVSALVTKLDIEREREAIRKLIIAL